MADIKIGQENLKPKKRRKVFWVITIISLILVVAAIIFYAYWFYVISGLVNNFGENLGR